MTAALNKILTSTLLEQMAGQRIYARGENYLSEGRVQELALWENELTAIVHGTETYQVVLWSENGKLGHRCSCPMGFDYDFCKHCVAVGLAYLEDPDSVEHIDDDELELDAAAPAPKKPRVPRKGMTIDDVEAYLNQLDKQTLVQMVLQQTKQDKSFKQKLTLKAASQQPSGINLTIIRRELRNAIHIRGFVDYYEAAGYAEDVETAVYALQDLINQGHADQVVHLAEEAVTLLEEALNNVDDSNGYLNEVIDDLPRIHFDACLAAAPDPIALAERLFQLELNSGYGFFQGAVETHADVLGDAGIRHFGRLARQEWEKVAPPPGRVRDRRRSYSDSDYKRRKLQRMIEASLDPLEDLEAIVEIRKRDLSGPDSYLAISSLYREQGQYDQALYWAEEGKRVFAGDYRDYGIRTYLIALYEELGRDEEAMALQWEDFSRSPSLEAYQRLLVRAGGEDEAGWRSRALEHLHTKLKAQKKSNKKSRARSPQMWSPAADLASTIVKIHLANDDVEAAWQVAQTNACSHDLRMRLADLRSETHPGDSVKIYQDAVDPLVDQKNNAAYGQAVEVIGKMRNIMGKRDLLEEFEDWLDEVRQQHKRKRNFIKLLDAQGW